MDNEVFLLLMVLGVFAGFVDSAVGGGGLLRLPAMISAGLPPHVALGTNKFASAAAIKESNVIPVTVGMGAGLGFYEGFLGPGTGSMLMAGYIKGAGFGMDRAAATGRILNFGGNIGSFAIFAMAASVNYEVAIPFALANMIGGFLAPGYVLRYGYSLLRPMFLIVAAIMILAQIMSILS